LGSAPTLQSGGVRSRHTLAIDLRPERPLYPEHFPTTGSPTWRGGSGPALLEDGPSNESRLLLEYLLLLNRNKMLLCLPAILGLLAGLLFSYLQTPLYLARASVEIQGLNGDYLNLKSFDPTTTFQDFSPEGQVLTQAKIIESDSAVERVARELTSRYAKDSKQVKGAEEAIAYATQSLQVRLIPDTRILELTCSSPNGRIAADFTNSLVDDYITQNLESRTRAIQQTEAALQALLRDVKAKLQQAEQDLLAYAQRSQLIFTGEAHTSVAEDKLRQVQEALSTTESERAAKQSQFEATAGLSPELIPTLLDDVPSRDNESKLADLRTQLADAATYMAPTHPKVVRLNAQIATLEESIRSQGVRLSKKIGSDYDTAKRREQLLRSNYAAQSKLVADQAQKTIQYTILKRETETNRALYDSLLQKVKEAGVAEAMRANNVRPLDRAKEALKPFRPRYFRNALMALIAGLFIGIAFITMRERADFNIRAPGETEIRLRVPELGAIPTATLDHGGVRLLGTGENASESAIAPNARRSRSFDEAGNGTGETTAFAESFRATLTSLLFSSHSHDHHAIVITSASAGEGKSTIISHLGAAMAETERRVLLIDGDLRQPQLHKKFNIPDDVGLVDWLKSGDFSKQTLERLVVPAPLHAGLYLLPAGNVNGNISNLLHSVRLPKLLHYLRTEFDAVLIDSPPMLLVPDARVLGRAAGAVILVIRAGQTSRDTAMASRQRLAEDGTPVIGTILNSWDMRGASANAYRNYGGYRRGSSGDKQ
jgi:polysaccharide biosynthesis transport protein